MKKELFAGLLTLTIGLAIATPSLASVKETKSHTAEKHFAQHLSLKLQAPARYKTDEGQYIQGSIYLELDQTPHTPSETNQIHAEMQGYLYFQGDDANKTFVALTEDNGQILADLIHKSKEEDIYQIYGCVSDLSICEAEQFQVTFKPNGQITMNLHLNPESSIELNSTYSVSGEQGTEAQRTEWTRYLGNVVMTQTTVSPSGK